MKRKTYFIIFILLISFLVSCSGKSANSNDNLTNSSETQQNEKNTESSINTARTILENPNEWDTVSVKGENNNFTLHSIDFLDENTGWMIQDRYNNETDSVNSQLLNTQDGGTHWEKTGSDNMMLNKIKFIDRKAGWAVSQNRIDSSAGSDLKEVQYKILHTENGGTDWDVQWEGNNVSPSDPGLWFEDEMNGIVLAGNLLLVTTDGRRQWTPVIFGFADFKPQKMSFTDAETGWVMGTVGDKNTISVLQTTDGGVSWQQQFVKEYPNGPVGSIGIDFIDTKNGWFLTSNMATWTGDLYYTDDSGGNWLKINQIKCTRPIPKGINFISPQIGWIPLDVGAGPIDGGLMFTRDGGKSFNIAGRQPDTEPYFTQKIVSAREIEFISEQQGWAIGINTSYGNYLVRTEDGGITWTQVYPKLIPFKDISFVDNRQGFGLGQLSDWGALLYTTDGGDNWENITSFMQDYWPQKLSFVDGNNGWILSVHGLLRTQDGGKTWTWE